MKKDKDILNQDSKIDLSILSFQQNALKDTLVVLERGLYFYILMISLVFAYVISNDNSNREWLPFLFHLLWIITISVLIITTFLCYGLDKGLSEIKFTINHLPLNQEVYEHINHFLRRGTIALRVTWGFVCFSIICIFVFLIILNKKGYFS